MADYPTPTDRTGLPTRRNIDRIGGDPDTRVRVTNIGVIAARTPVWSSTGLAREHDEKVLGFADESPGPQLYLRRRTSTPPEHALRQTFAGHATVNGQHGTGTDLATKGPATSACSRARRGGARQARSVELPPTTL